MALNYSVSLRPNPLDKDAAPKAYATSQINGELTVNTQFRAYPFYKASEWMPHKKLLLNSIVF